MNNLPIEIKVIILNLLNFKSQINFVFASKNNQLLIKHWTIKKCCFVKDKMSKLSYYDCFENIEIYKSLCIYPKKVIYVTFDCYCSMPYFMKVRIPASVTYLTFGDWFVQPIKKIISTSITHLTLGFNFNQTVKNVIPLSVTHLTFGDNFNQCIKDCIPSSVTHITFGKNFNKSLKNCIPSEVTYLKFYKRFKKFKKEHIPANVKTIDFDFTD